MALGEGTATDRLPTEAEWEYSCCAGTVTPLAFDESQLDDHEWTIRNSGIKSNLVATKKPNPFGLYDMHGNLSEWCQNCFDESWYARSPTTDPLNVDPRKHFNVIRGGCWDYHSILRSAYRSAMTPNIFGYTIGFCGGRKIDLTTIL